jgi:hypothetical protein
MVLKVVVAMVEFLSDESSCCSSAGSDICRPAVSGKHAKGMTDLRFLHVRNKSVAMHKIAAGNAVVASDCRD